MQCGLHITSVQAFPGSDGTSTVTVKLDYGADRIVGDGKTIGDVMQPIVLLGSTAYGFRDHPFLTWTSANSNGTVHSDLTFIAKTDDLRSSPSLLVRDLEWGPSPYSYPITKDPTFQGISVFGAGSPDGKTFSAGWYTVSGTDLDQTTKVDCGQKDKSPCLELLDPDAPKCSKIGTSASAPTTCAAPAPNCAARTAGSRADQVPAGGIRRSKRLSRTWAPSRRSPLQ